ncbi:MAG: BrnA antitoxin family protein [Sulfurisoma sp.]|nr:BrnA antitoxin family protein [Sulfurisoma sp.]
MTDWDRVKHEAVADVPVSFDPAVDPYDPNDAAAVEAFWKAAVVRRPGQRGAQKAPKKVATAIRLSSEVVDYFKTGGPGWQTRVDAALLEYVKAHKTA